MTNRELLADLAAEGQSAEDLVRDLTDRAQWLRPSAAAGWTIAHQIGHLAWTDRVALVSVRDPDAFGGYLDEARADAHGMIERGAAEGPETVSADGGGPALLSRWRDGRKALLAALEDADPDVKVPWFGPPMKPASLATARLMETFAHGQDIADALGIERPVTGRVRHVCYLGVRTRDYAFSVHGLPAPAEPFFVELSGPSGEHWSWGPEDARQYVRGSAHDFALLVTRRRHRADLAVRATGPDADRWLDIAQAFAGAPGQPPARR